MVDSIKNNICGKTRRDLIPGTLEVHPMDGYGALQIGSHRFCDVKAKQCDGKSGGVGKFIHLLHHYDRLGLLKPSRTDAGYRVYVDADLERLEEIIALKSLGFSLKQVRAILARGPIALPDALRLQRYAIEDKQAHLSQKRST